MQKTLRITMLLNIIAQISTLGTSSEDSVLDLINTKEVERIIAQRKENEERLHQKYLQENEIDETYVHPDYEFEYQRIKLPEDEPEILDKAANTRIDVDLFLRRNNFSEPYRSADLLQDLRGFKGRKVLKSSKNALYVTKMEYLQRDWCKTEPLIQKIKEEGCLTRNVVNKFCYGQCNSFYIPKNPKRKNRRRTNRKDETEEEDLNGPAFKSCAFCKPLKFTWVTVTLKCPNSTPMFKKRRIQRIKQCKCF